MRIALVTGGAGFIGAAVVEALARDGYEVRTAGTPEDPLTRDRIAAAVDGVELVVHCAGTSSVADANADPAREYARTVVPFENLLEHPPRVILISSAAVYGNATIVPTPEDAPIQPVSPYGQHKRACEERLLARGNGTIVRLFSVYGAGLRKQLLWDACCKARDGAPVFGGTGDEERDWLHVTDAAALVVRVASDSTVSIVNGGAGRGVRVRDVVGQICSELGAPAPRFTGEYRAGDPQRYVADISRARALDWSPRVALEAGIAAYVAWFRA